MHYSSFDGYRDIAAPCCDADAEHRESRREEPTFLHKNENDSVGVYREHAKICV
jgi:hypothetical protein